MAMLDGLSAFFAKVNSFEIDPETGAPMPRDEIDIVCRRVQLATRWMFSRICREQLEPIKITMENINKDMQIALNDARNIGEPILKPHTPLEQVYLTPQFLQHFDC